MILARGLTIALALALFLAGLQTLRLGREQAVHAETQRKYAEQMGYLEREASLATDAAREEEKRRTAEVQKVADEAHKDLERARADAAAAVDAGQRLRDRIAAITAGCGRATGHPGSASGGAPAVATADLLADMQRRLDEAQDRIAEFADRSHAAGNACQRAYDKVGSPPDASALNR